MLYRWVLSLCCAFLIPRPAHGQATREILIPTEHRSAAELKVSSGVLIIHRNNPVPLPAAGEHSVVLLDRNGNEVFRRAPAIDVRSAKVVSIDDAAAGMGRLVIAATAMNADNQMASLLLYYDVEAQALIRTVRTNPITCRRITVGQTGDTWCVGINFERFNRGDHAYDVIYRYGSSGLLLHSFFPRSMLPKITTTPLRNGDMGGPLVTSVAGRITAWLPGLGILLNWTEATERVTTTEIASVEALNKATEVVALEDGRVVTLRPVSTVGSDRRLWRRGFFVKDASDASWMKIPLPDMSFGSSLLGVDNEGLVIWDRSTGRVQWFGYP